MAESQINLKEKTAVLAGPLSRMFQSLGPRLAECGADVAFISEDISVSSKFANNINENREINSNFGRATAIESKFACQQNVTDAIGRVAECFGGVDIIIDGHQLHVEKLLENKDLTEQLSPSLALSEGALPFLLGRKKGRFLFTYHDAFYAKDINKPLVKFNEQMSEIIKNLSLKTLGSQVTVNGLATGPTEEYLMQMFSDSGTVKDALQSLREIESTAKLVEPFDVANLVTFFSSPLSLAINGQTIRVNYGLN